MSHPLQTADDKGEQGKPAQSKAKVHDVKHSGASLRDAANLNLLPVRMPFGIGQSGVKAA